MAQLPGQLTHGGSTAQPPAPLLPHLAHQGSVAARAARVRRKRWETIPSAGKNTSRGYSALTARHRERRGRSVVPTVSWPPNSMRAACPSNTVENALVLAASRRLFRPGHALPLGHDSLPGLFSPRHQRGARSPRQPRLLPLPPPPNRRLLFPAFPPTDDPLTRYSRPCDCSTPAAWDDVDHVTLCNPHPPRHAFGVDDNDVLPLTPNLVPNAGPARGSLQLSTTGSLLPSAEGRN